MWVGYSNDEIVLILDFQMLAGMRTETNAEDHGR